RTCYASLPASSTPPRSDISARFHGSRTAISPRTSPAFWAMRRCTGRSCVRRSARTRCPRPTSPEGRQHLPRQHVARTPFNEFIARYLKAVGDRREVVRDPAAQYWGDSLVPLGEARRGCIGLDEWLRRAHAAA